jgi:hypothetical protein|tara:strand:+ start:551 stop:1120 length:570 start_codon:yes stop_codon:yes gene_type:complete
MPFWSSGKVEPKRQFRFLVTLAGMEQGATWYAKSATKPGVTVGSTPHAFLNHTFYYPGKVTWSEVQVVLVDPVNPDATGNLLSILRRAGYNVPGNLNEPDATTTIGKGNATAQLGSVIIRGIDEDGNILEQWTLNNPFITDVAFNGYDYGAEDLSDITVKFRYDWAAYEIPETPGRDPGELVERRLFQA